MNAHDQLNHQLRASVANNPGRKPGVRVRFWEQGLSALAAVAGVALALGIAAFALIALKPAHPPSSEPTAPQTTNHRGELGLAPRNPGPTPRDVDGAAVAAAWKTAWKEARSCDPQSAPASKTAASPSAAMLSTIPVLRRPFTPADQPPTTFHGHEQPLVRSGNVYIRFVRRARVNDGITFYLVPAKVGRPALSPADANRCYQLTVAALQAQIPNVAPAKRAPTLRYGKAEFALSRYHLETQRLQEGVFLLTQFANGDAVADGGQSPSTIRHTGMLGGAGTPPGPTVMDGIVPPGVATVTLKFPSSHHGNRHLPALAVTGAVVHNVFVIPIPTLFQRGGWPSTAVWRSATGNVIRTIDERPFHP